jgi:hypothetical protein
MFSPCGNFLSEMQPESNIFNHVFCILFTCLAVVMGSHSLTDDIGLIDKLVL